MTPWTVAHQDSLSMRFPRQEYWSGLPFSPPGDKVISLTFNFLGKFYIHSDYDSSRHPHICPLFVCTHTVLDKHTLLYLRIFWNLLLYVTELACVLSHTVASDSLQPRGLKSARFLCPWSFPSKGTGAGCHFLLQG